MTKATPNSDMATQAATLIPSEFLDVAKKSIETLFDVQKDLMQTLEGINHELFSHAKKEAELASEFVGRFAGARSVPDATTTYREWATKEMELMAADGRQMFAHGEKIMQVSQRLFSNIVHSTGN
jgi:cell division septum initiation protein DivIVA